MKDIVINYDVYTKKACQTKFILLGDIHDQYFFKYFDKIIKHINEIDADLILIAGDLVNTGKTWNDVDKYEKVKKMLTSLSKDKKIVISLGNHDLYKLNQNGVDNFNSLEEIENVYPLFNKSVDLNINGDNIHIDGYVMQKRAFVTKPNDKKHIIKNDLEETIDDELKTLNSFDTLDDNKFNILLNHDPRFFRNLKIKEAGDKYDIITGAHMHNGYMPNFYTTKFNNMYDCDYFYLLSKKNTAHKGYTRGVIYGNLDEFILLDQQGNYFSKKDNKYHKISEDFAKLVLKNQLDAPIIITGGMNKYVSLPIDSAEITTFKVKRLVR